MLSTQIFLPLILKELQWETTISALLIQPRSVFWWTIFHMIWEGKVHNRNLIKEKDKKKECKEREAADDIAKNVWETSAKEERRFE